MYVCMYVCVFVCVCMCECVCVCVGFSMCVLYNIRHIFNQLSW